MADLKRWIILHKIYLLSVIAIFIFAWMDAKQIKSFQILNTTEAWALYNQYTGPAIWSLWAIILVLIGVIWYIIHKDKSEAVALAVSGNILLLTGTEDVLFYLFSPQT